jgi:hypothetical protein
MSLVYILDYVVYLCKCKYLHTASDHISKKTTPL